jgi:DNA-binding CsgD family transcriptional regulator
VTTLEATLTDYERGYYTTESYFHCLFCDTSYDKEQVYSIGRHFFTAKKCISLHLKEVHGGPLNALLSLNRGKTGLSESQQEILALFAQNLSDSVIAQRLGISNSTVRNHRFKLKEKERQAKVFLSIMAHLEDKDFILPHTGATMVDDRYAITAGEREKIIATYFDQDGFIQQFPSKEKRKLVVLSILAQKFDPQKNYSETAVNDILKQAISDYVTVRRYLIEYGFMQRTKDGKTYWLTTN